MSAFQVINKEVDGFARRGRITTAHGIIETPCFMPVGTKATVKGLTPKQLEEEVGAQIVLGNTYHLFLRPGHELIKKLGGLHKFMGWSRPILTDSGGFQVFSLSSLRRIEEGGVTFRSPIDGSTHHLTPESSISIQEDLGADIIMAFDECTPYPATHKEALDSLELTARWAARSLNARQRSDNLLFGIIQGSTYPELRRLSLEKTVAVGFDGYALGGLSVGEGQTSMYDVVNEFGSQLPEAAPRYLMGVGTPEDLLVAVAAGLDMFDCVMPTRNARNGMYFTSYGPLSIKQARFREDPGPIDARCNCYTCRNFSRAYLRHLFMAKEILSSVLATIHNLHFYNKLMAGMRDALVGGEFQRFKSSFLADYKSQE
ncbi:MAG: tRNA guanosine(34) transglycosylase Tgt [Deltaproteobacteria bacterium]|nr:tRNA guanosine(34) transglycosylase Tgt [Candidatus Tharpella aukensis]